MDGIPDFFICESESQAIGDRNAPFLSSEMAEVRDTTYRLCTRELKGMAFCMQEISRRTGPGRRVLEAGMGTGHFTRWLAEVSVPGTEIYACDASWPMIEKAKVNAGGLPGVALFRANARGGLPFKNEAFDILFLRLAPLGPHGVPNAQAAFELLKPGGWYFDAVWEREQFETPPTEWAIQHGYGYAEHHVWRYFRLQSEEEGLAGQRAMDLMAKGDGSVAKVEEMRVGRQVGDEGILKMTVENLLIAQKPLQSGTGLERI